MYSQHQYSFIHLVFILFYLIILTVSLIFCKTQKRKDVLIIVVCIITFALTACTRFTYFNTPIFPNTLCSLVGMLLPILVVLQKHKKENALINTCVYSGILGGVLVILSGNAFNTESTIFNLCLNMSYHFCIFYLGLLVILNKRTNLLKRNNKYVLLYLGVLLITSIILKGIYDLKFDYLYFYYLDIKSWLTIAIVFSFSIYLISFIFNKFQHK